MEHAPGIAPVPQGAWSKEQIRAVAPMMPPEGSVYAERRAQRGGAGGNKALSLLVRNPGLAEAFLTFNRHLLYESELDERTKELVVLRVSRLLNSEYEWSQHEVVARQCGIDDEEIQAVWEGPDHDSWSTEDRELLRCVDDLIRTGQIDDAALTGLQTRYGDETVLELVFTVGAYATLAMAFNVARLPLDDGMEGFARSDSGGGEVA